MPNFPQRWLCHARNRIKFGLLTALLVGIAFCADAKLVLAAETPGSDPARPLTPADVWVALDNGQRHWYAFRDEGDAVAIIVRMTVLPANGATFRVLTPAQAAQAVRGEDFAAVGAGAQHPFFNNDFYWTGSFVQSGPYYVLVESTGRGISNYRLTISGNDVSFPTDSTALADQTDRSTTDISVAPEPTPTAAVSPTNQQAVSISSAENPFAPVGQIRSLTSNATHWYAFRDEGDEASIQVRAVATPATCITFQVWTPEQLQLWQRGETFRPVGQGTANAPLKADLFWTGSFVKSGTYYVVVEPAATANTLCTYRLWVTGDDVSLALPPDSP